MNLNMMQKKEFFNQMNRFYDLSEGILDAIEAPNAAEPELQLRLVENIITQTDQSTNTVLNIFMDLVEQDRKPSPKEVREVERAMRLIFLSVQQFVSEIKKLPVG